MATDKGRQAQAAAATEAKQAALITGSGKVFAELFALSTGVVKARSPRKILEYVKFTATKVSGEVRLESTDFDVSLCVIGRGLEVGQDVSVLLPGLKTAAALAELAGEESVRLGFDGTLATVTAPNAVVHLNGLQAEEFPTFPDFDESCVIEMKQGDFREMVNQVSYACAQEALRYALNGVLLVVESGAVEMVGTDGHRLAYTRRKVQLPKDFPQTIIIPPKALRQVERMLAPEDKYVELNILENQVLARSSKGIVAAKLLEGQFPNFREVVPKDLPVKLRVAKEEFGAALRRAALLTTDDNQGVTLKFTSGTLMLSSKSPDAGDVTVNFPVDYEGAGLTIQFVGRYLQDAVKAVSEDELELELRDGDTAGVIRGSKNAYSLIMPMAV
ncbi:MAG: DNA polymerase III subunit beta [Planctomycetes bacterium]|nr:DNA polymerase III subunit beta [Planctomycetota bacterium]